MLRRMVQPRGSIHNRHSNTPQRNGFDQVAECISNDSQDQISDNSGSDLDELDGKIRRPNKLQKQIKIDKSSSVSRTPRLKERSRQNVVPLHQVECKSNKNWLLYFFAVILLLMGAYYCYKQQEKKQCSFAHLQKQYRTENEQLWNRLKVGVESILNKQTKKPAVYLFTHRGGQLVFQLIKDIAAHSSGCFGNEMVPIQMERDDFASTPDMEDDYGHAIQKYRNKIKEGNVILIGNLNEIPAKAARALHTICDTHSPIVKNVVIFLTLTIQSNKNGSAAAIAEETLVDLWGSKLDRYELDPLITRVTDEVIILHS